MDKAGNGFCFLSVVEKLCHFCILLKYIVVDMKRRERMPKLNQDESPFYRHFFFDRKSLCKFAVSKGY